MQWNGNRITIVADRPVDGPWEVFVCSAFLLCKRIECVGCRVPFMGGTGCMGKMGDGAAVELIVALIVDRQGKRLVGHLVRGWTGRSTKEMRRKEKAGELLKTQGSPLSSFEPVSASRFLFCASRPQARSSPFGWVLGVVGSRV